MGKISKTKLLIKIIMITIFAIITVSVNAKKDSKRPSILFIHHSVGERLIIDGSVREILTREGIDFWDHGWNHPKKGLKNPEGTPAGCYWIPENNTRPHGYAKLFSLNPNGDNPFGKIIKNHDMIIFKSCFPTSKIENDDSIKDKEKPWRKSLSNYKQHYLSIRDSIDNIPNKLFILVTPPPLHPNASNLKEALRARALTEWLKSEKFIEERKNLFVFDLFDLLSDPKTNMLRFEYQLDPKDKNSHPNPIANMIIGPKFADFIINTVKYGRYSNTDNITLDNKEWPFQLIRSLNPTVELKGKVKEKKFVKKIIWSDLKDQSGELPVNDTWKIEKIKLIPGTTKILITSIDKNGIRNSTVIGIQYYSGKGQRALIFERAKNEINLSGLLYSKQNPINGKPCLVIEGDKTRKRAVISNINLDISDFDPIKSFLEIEFDQGKNKSSPVIIIQGIGTVSFKADNKHGYETIRIPLKKYQYLNNTLDKLIIKGNWKINTRVYIQSIRLISS